mmetsp:Transcript_24640/g.77243  ORF Transcript_24640/g.77243 Transcript_24640/m.77243 type:complete len:249 (-) Transcript_24640:109-855(-)
MNERFSSVLRLVTLLVRLASGHAVDGALRREVEDVPEERLREGEHQNGSARAGDVGQATMLHAVIEEQRVADAQQRSLRALPLLAGDGDEPEVRLAREEVRAWAELRRAHVQRHVHQGHEHVEHVRGQVRLLGKVRPVLVPTLILRAVLGNDDAAADEPAVLSEDSLHDLAQAWVVADGAQLLAERVLGVVQVDAVGHLEALLVPPHDLGEALLSANAECLAARLDDAEALAELPLEPFAQRRDGRRR